VARESHRAGSFVHTANVSTGPACCFVKPSKDSREPLHMQGFFRFQVNSGAEPKEQDIPIMTYRLDGRKVRVLLRLTGYCARASSCRYLRATPHERGH